jgi:hypothetical protein
LPVSCSFYIINVCLFSLKKASMPAKPTIDLPAEVSKVLSAKKALPLRPEGLTEEEHKYLRSAETAYTNAAILDALGLTSLVPGHGTFPDRSPSGVQAETTLSLVYDDVFFAKNRPVQFDGDEKNYGFIGGAAKVGAATRDAVQEVLGANKSRIKEQVSDMLAAIKGPREAGD